MLLGCADRAAVPCGQSTVEQLEQANDLLRRSAAAGGAVRAPSLCAAARAALVEAEAELAVLKRRRPIAPDCDRVGDLARRARTAAERCALRATSLRNRSRARAEARLADLDRGIALAAALVRHLPHGDPARDVLRQAEIAAGEARAGFTRQEFERAEGAASRGSRRVAEAVRAANSFIDSFARHPRRDRWRDWIKETLREGRKTEKPVVLVDKLRRRLLVLRGKEEIAAYRVELGISAIEDKVHAGDEATPEGRYHVTEVRKPGNTRYHRALMLDYPNADDRAEFARRRRAGELAGNQGIGAHIEIHGEGGRGLDWTQGCVALTNEEMDELVELVGKGTAVTIVGTIPEGALP